MKKIPHPTKDKWSMVTTFLAEVSDLILVLLRDYDFHSYKEIGLACFRQIRPEWGARRYEATGKPKPPSLDVKISHGKQLLIEDALASLKDKGTVIVLGKNYDRDLKLAEASRLDRKISKMLKGFVAAEMLVSKEFRRVLADGRWHRLDEAYGSDRWDSLFRMLRRAAGPGVPEVGKTPFVQELVERMAASGECAVRKKKDASAWDGIAKEYRRATTRGRRPGLSRQKVLRLR